MFLVNKYSASILFYILMIYMKSWLCFGWYLSRFSEISKGFTNSLVTLYVFVFSAKSDWRPLRRTLWRRFVTAVYLFPYYCFLCVFLLLHYCFALLLLKACSFLLCDWGQIILEIMCLCIHYYYIFFFVYLLYILFKDKWCMNITVLNIPAHPTH